MNLKFLEFGDELQDNVIHAIECLFEICVDHIDRFTSLHIAYNVMLKVAKLYVVDRRLTKLRWFEPKPLAIKVYMLLYMIQNRMINRWHINRIKYFTKGIKWNA